MDIKTFVKESKFRLIDIAKLITVGKYKEGYAAFGSLAKNIPYRAPSTLPNLLAGLVVSSVQAQLNPRKFEDPLTAFEDPLTAFEDPLTAFEDPLTAFKDPTLRKHILTLINTVK